MAKITGSTTPDDEEYVLQTERLDDGRWRATFNDFGDYEGVGETRWEAALTLIQLVNDRADRFLQG